MSSRDKPWRDALVCALKRYGAEQAVNGDKDARGKIADRSLTHRKAKAGLGLEESILLNETEPVPVEQVVPPISSRFSASSRARWTEQSKNRRPVVRQLWSITERNRVVGQFESGRS